jgi:FkbM family methyltransferase
MTLASPIERTRWKLANALWPGRLGQSRLLTRWRLRACEAAATERWRELGGEGSGRPRPEARSQTGEDALLWDLVGDRRSGFFVEAGAYDGYELSVSYLFECAGWSGLLVEPLPGRAAECARRRTGSRVVAAALSRPGAPDVAPFTRVPSFEMYSTLEVTEEHANVLERENRETVVTTASTVTLDSLLEGHTGSIDFVVLDVEGHELAVLEGFDLQRWRPTALLVEDNTRGEDGAVRKHVERFGYAYVGSLSQNDLFLREDELSLAKRLGQFWDDLGPVG